MPTKEEPLYIEEISFSKFGTSVRFDKPLKKRLGYITSLPNKIRIANRNKRTLIIPFVYEEHTARSMIVTLPWNADVRVLDCEVFVYIHRTKAYALSTKLCREGSAYAKPNPNPFDPQPFCGRLREGGDRTALLRVERAEWASGGFPTCVSAEGSYLGLKIATVQTFANAHGLCSAYRLILSSMNRFKGFGASNVLVKTSDPLILAAMIGNGYHPTSCAQSLHRKILGHVKRGELDIVEDYNFDHLSRLYQFIKEKYIEKQVRLREEE